MSICNRFASGCVVCCALLVQSSRAEAQTIRFVDDDAALSGDGLSWNTAYRFLQDAMFEAATDPTIDEIRVGQGVYTPDQDETGNVMPMDRTATFLLLSGMALRGGYRGLAGGGAADDRDIAAFETVLSGDLAGDDYPFVGTGPSD